MVGNAGVSNFMEAEGSAKSHRERYSEREEQQLSRENTGKRKLENVEDKCGEHSGRYQAYNSVYKRRVMGD